MVIFHFINVQKLNLTKIGLGQLKKWFVHKCRSTKKKLKLTGHTRDGGPGYLSFRICTN